MRKIEILNHEIGFWLKPLNSDEETTLPLIEDEATAEFIEEQILANLSSGELNECVVDSNMEVVECTGKWFIIKNPELTEESAKAYLEEQGYAMQLVVSVHDVLVKYKCDLEKAKEVIQAFDGNDSVSEEINVRLSITADIFELEEKEECNNCGSTDTWSNSGDELQCDNCGHSETE